ncbi:hypothetical protein [Salmonella enterica]|uniref:hypothetical protein n=1 Tax=Salmonella enterica TaxID=28901 RepID=UPI001E55B7D0|nr:hypothetical protein [Salmonella enterica]
MAIVNINVSVTSPPKPSQLLKSGALVSTGGTTLAAGSYQLLTSKRRSKKYRCASKSYFFACVGREYRHGDSFRKSWLVH